VQNLCRRQNDEPYDRESYQGARGSKKISIRPNSAELLGLFVWGMLAAAIAELGELKAARGRLFILRRRVIPLFAFRTLEGNYFTHSLS
jgi:hypothetical protein